MHLFSGIIKCAMCGKNFNYKPNNQQDEYICQTRKNKGLKSCVSPVIKERFLVDIIEQHCRIQNKDFTTSKIKLFVKEIKVDEQQIKIIYRDGTISTIKPNQIVF